MNDEDFIAKMSTLHHRFLLQSDAERLIAIANASLTEREKGYKAGLEAAAKIAIKHPSSSGFDIAKDIRGAE